MDIIHKVSLPNFLSKTLFKYNRFVWHTDYNEKIVAIYRKVINITTAAAFLLGCGGLSTCTIYVFSPILKNFINYFEHQPMVREQPFKVV